MLRFPLRLLRTTVTRSTVVRPIPATAAALRRPKSSAAAAAPRDDAAPPAPKPRVAVDAEIDDDDDDDMEDMFVDTSMGKEWGGPTRGGRMPEPTRFGDWERKGRATDF